MQLNNQKYNKQMEKEVGSSLSYSNSNPQSPAISVIADVWEHNFRAEIKRLSSLLSQFPIVSFVSLHPIHSFILTS